MHTKFGRTGRIPASRTRRGVATALAVLGCAAVVSACGSSGSSPSSTTKTSRAAPTVDLDTAHVARAIEHSITTQRHKSSHVVCPSVVVQRQGVTFKCQATVLTPKKPSVVTPFLVTVTSNKGHVTYVGQ